MAASNVKIFDKVTANSSDYMVPWNRYDVTNLPLELKLIKLAKPGTEPVLFVKPIMKKPDGVGEFLDLVICTRPSRILFQIVPYDDKAKKYVSLTDEEMIKVYDAVPAGGSKTFDMCIEAPPDMLAFGKAVDNIVKNFVIDNVDRFPNLVKAKDKGANLIFYPTVIERKGKDGADSTEHLKTKLYFKDGEFDLKAFDADKNETSLRVNRSRLYHGKVNPALKFGNVWTNPMGGYGYSWKVLGGHFEFAVNVQKPATCDDLFRAFSETMGDPLPTSSSKSVAAAGSKAATTVVDDDDFDDDEAEVAVSDAIAAAAAPVAAVVVASDDEEEDDGEVVATVDDDDDDDDEDDDDEDDEDDEDDDAAATAAAAAAAETQRKEAEAAAKAAADAAKATKAAKAAKKLATVATVATVAATEVVTPVTEVKEKKGKAKAAK